VAAPRDSAAGEGNGGYDTNHQGRGLVADFIPGAKSPVRPPNVEGRNAEIHVCRWPP